MVTVVVTTTGSDSIGNIWHHGEQPLVLAGSSKMEKVAVETANDFHKSNSHAKIIY